LAFLEKTALGSINRHGAHGWRESRHGSFRPNTESFFTAAAGGSLVIDFLAERFEPAANTETLSESALYTDYAYWCRASDRVALSAAEFVTGFDQLRAENGLGKIRKRKGGYRGIRLATSHEMLMTGECPGDAPCRALSVLVTSCRALSRPVAPCRATSRSGGSEPAR